MRDNGAAPLAKRPWTALMPWLEAYRQGPSILSADEIIPNAWLDTSPATGLSAANFDRFCSVVAAQYVRSRPGRALAADFPTVPAEGPVTALNMRSRTSKALVHNGITEVDQLLRHSAESLRNLPQVGDAALVDVITGLVALAATVPGDEPNPREPAEADEHLDAFIEALDARDRLILHERIFAARPRTQLDIAGQLGLSRERVNQLDRALRMQVTDIVEASAPLRHLVAEIVARADPVAEVADLVEQVPSLGATLPTLEVPVLQLVVAGSSHITLAGDWIVRGSLQDANSQIREVLDRLSGPESVAPVRLVARELGLSEDASARWLSRCGFAVLRDHVVTASTSTNDLIAAVLSIEGASLTFDQIVDALADMPRSRSSVRNALVTDRRFVKTDRTTYGLHRWGGHRYVPVHRQIGEILTEAGGQMAIDELVSRIRSRYDVTETSIRAYAGRGEFETRDHVVTRREKQPVHRKSPAKTRYLYRDGNTVRWRTTVSRLHLKGSASNIPSALAGIVGVGPDNPVQLPSRLGPQSIIWVSVQARLGTIKRFVADLEVGEGDEIFLEFGNGGFDVVRFPPAQSTSDTRRVLQLLGRAEAGRVSRRQLMDILIESLWLPADSPAQAVIAALTHRREDELATLVTGIFT